MLLVLEAANAHAVLGSRFVVAGLADRLNGKSLVSSSYFDVFGSKFAGNRAYGQRLDILLSILNAGVTV